MQPIQILSDNQQLQLLFQQKLKSTQQTHFSMLSRTQKLQQYIISKHQGLTKQQKETQCTKQVIQYFKTKCDVDLQKNFEEKFTPDYEEEGIMFQMNAVVVYGVDYMNTTRLVRYFRYFESNIQWIDDSSCKVIFESQEEMEKMIKNFEVRSQEEKMVGVMEEEGINERRWYELRGYSQFGIWKKLYARVATNKDKVKTKEQLNNLKTRFNTYDFERERYKNILVQEMNEIYKINQFVGERRRDREYHNRSKRICKEYRNQNHKERRGGGDRGGFRGDRDREYRGGDRDRNRFRGRDRDNEQPNLSFQRCNPHPNDSLLSRPQSNYSYRVHPNQQPSFQQQANLSFEKCLNICLNQSNIENSRCNYSFAVDQKIKEEAEMMVDVNMSFNVGENGNGEEMDNLLEGMKKLNLSVNESMNLSFRKGNQSQIKEGEVIVIDDD